MVIIYNLLNFSLHSIFGCAKSLNGQCFVSLIEYIFFRGEGFCPEKKEIDQTANHLELIFAKNLHVGSLKQQVASSDLLVYTKLIRLLTIRKGGMTLHRSFGYIYEKGNKF